MTTEDDFQNALDANPDDWQTRLVLADWLQERGDPRAEGYRALGVLRKNPRMWKGARQWFWWDDGHRSSYHADADIPTDWFSLLPAPDADDGCWPEDNEPKTRREAEDAAALAFAKLPASRRAELLRGEAVRT